MFTKKAVATIAQKVIDGLKPFLLKEINLAIEELYDSLARSLKKVQPVVAQVTINANNNFYASSLAFMVPGETREVTIQSYSDIPPGAVLQLNDERIVIVGLNVGNVQQSMSNDVPCRNVVLKDGCRLSTWIKIVLEYPLPVSLI